MCNARGHWRSLTCDTGGQVRCQVTDGDADLGKSLTFPLLNSFPKVVSSVSSVTMVWLKGYS
jgi:hypothetical protein